MMKLLAILAIAALLSGCLTTRSTSDIKRIKIDSIVAYLAVMAPEGKDSAIDGYRIVTLKNVGKWQVHFLGLYRDEDILRARSFDVEGMLSRYEGAPFAHPIPQD